MNLLIGAIVMFNFQSDSLSIDTVIQSQSIMFKSESEKSLNTYKYKHTQGFFCDFEDNINKNKKIQLNLGVGEQ